MDGICPRGQETPGLHKCVVDVEERSMQFAMLYFFCSIQLVIMKLSRLNLDAEYSVAVNWTNGLKRKINFEPSCTALHSYIIK